MSLKTPRRDVEDVHGRSHRTGSPLHQPLRRRILHAVVVLSLGLGLALLPGIGRSTGDPPRTRTQTIRLEGWQQTGRWSVSRPVGVDDVVLVGAPETGGGLEVRTRRGGRWGEWLTLAHVAGHGHDDASEPVWTGRSDAVQVRRRTGVGPVELVTVAVRGGDGLDYAPNAAPGAALAAGHPVVTRQQWDPRGECRPRKRPEYGVARLAYVHHTVMFPRYAPDEADDVVRAICLFHVETRGFDDIGYNFLVDRYGTAYEGRAGGVDLPVTGAHAAGFNETSFGVTVIGNFQRDPVPPAALEAVSRLIADRFQRYNIDPRGRVRLQSTDEGSLSRFDLGASVTLPTIVGHRDTATNTLCPGANLYERLGSIRERVTDLLAAGRVPDVVSASAPVGRPATDLPELAVPAGDSSTVTGAVGVMAAPAPVADLPVTGAGWAAGAVLLAAGWWIAREIGRRDRDAPTAER